MVIEHFTAIGLGHNCGCFHGLLLPVVQKKRVGDGARKLKACHLGSREQVANGPLPTILSTAKSQILVRAETASKALSHGSLCPVRLRMLPDVSLEDRYTIGPALGEGASGFVKLITEKSGKASRVLKTLELPNAAEREATDEILNEMDVYLRLDHPNICRLLEVCVEDDRCHLVMEHCFGNELFERWAAAGRYTEAQTLAAVSQMFHAVSYLHAHDICHRDLKLENWVYATAEPTSSLKLIDFGFSRVMHDDTPMTEVLGTVYYIAPEVLQASYDRKCDIWSMGVLVYMLLVGYPPIGTFEDANSVVMHKILRGDPVTMDREWQEISENGQAFVLQLLRRDPQRRPDASRASEHRWIRQGGHTTLELCGEARNEVLDSMHSFASANLVKRVACCFMAYALSVDETQELEQQFKAFDRGNTGNIGLQDFVSAFTEHRNMCEEKAKDVFRKLDLTGKYRINYSEFLAAACQSRFVASEDNIKAAFRRFDHDNTGFISLANFRAVFGDEFKGAKVEDIFAQADINRDGLIEYDEFAHALLDFGRAISN
eukprot:CAMPEP_0170213144 /NCGR_PEP_ID=MMETSP0116_2-20130129/6193_1 /TAXON_ID=400756 /ORGANISM="Durinskia baltica, Strain CSIRO CS-38" /LENGTH=545 /DNA_ID=CAMNT_0010463689 /DNA_START=54 /DNA_END=1691 /DNA_ORIENTATION=+